MVYNNSNPVREFMKIFTILFLVSLVLGGLYFANDSFYIVRPGFTAMHTRLGAIIAQNNAGYYFKFPIIDAVQTFDMRIQKARPDVETKAMSKDLQPVDVGIVVNYRVSDARKIYQEIGTDFEHIIIDPFTQETVKAIIARFTAEDLIQRRHEAKDMVITELAERLASRHIQLIDCNFTHLDFSKAFIHAVEDKQIAEQHAKQAKNLTEKVKEEALQTRTRAEAEAFSLKVKRESVTQELIRLQEIEAQLKAIEKWNGVLPSVTGTATPFISLPKMQQ